jgi:hypothetical protein
VNRGQPGLDAPQLCRVKVEAAQIVAQRAGCLLELDCSRFEQRDGWERGAGQPRGSVCSATAAASPRFSTTLNRP